MLLAFFSAAMAQAITYNLDTGRCYAEVAQATSRTWTIVDSCVATKAQKQPCGPLLAVCPGNVAAPNKGSIPISDLYAQLGTGDVVARHLMDVHEESTGMFNTLAADPLTLVDLGTGGASWADHFRHDGRVIPIKDVLAGEFPFAEDPLALEGGERGAWTRGWLDYLSNRRKEVMAESLRRAFSGCKKERDSICVDHQGIFRRLVLSLAEMPPSRLSCDIYQKSGQRLSVSWDPLLDSPLTQSITLPLGEGVDGWVVGCWSRPVMRKVIARDEEGGGVRRQFEGDIDLAWRPAGSLTSQQQGAAEAPVLYPDYHAAGTSSKVMTTVRFDVPQITLRSAGGVPELSKLVDQEMLSIIQLPAVRLDDARRGLLAGELSGQAGQRSFLDATVPSVVNDTLDILSDIAMERANRGAADALADQLAYIVCEDLVVPEVKVGNGVILPKGPLLPNTCDIVRGMPLAGLVNAGDSLGKALQSDAYAFSMAVVAESTIGDTNLSAALTRHVVPLFRATSPVLLDVMQSQRTPTPREYRLLLAAIANHDWTGSNPSVSECGIELAVSVAATCVEGGGCDADRIADMLDRPSRYFDVDDNGCSKHLESNGKPVGLAMRRLGPNLEAIAAHLVDAALPTADTTERERAARVFEIVFEAAALVVRESQGCPADVDFVTGILGHTEDMVAGMLVEDERAYLTAGFAIFRDVMVYVIEQVPAPKAMNLLKLRDWAAQSDDRQQLATLTATRVALERVTPWTVVLANHARALAQPGATEEDAAAARDARAAALEDLIDATTSRQNRDGDVVVALGANVGFRAAAELGTTNTTWASPLSLPMGFAMQRLPNRDPVNRAKQGKPLRAGVGWHLQLTLVDLSYFLQHEELEDVRWNDFVAVGGQAGFMVGTPSVPFTLGIDYRYQVVSGRHEAGVMLTYYVPFVDFN